MDSPRDSQPQIPTDAPPQILTVGHSSHPLEHFLGLLGGEGIEVVADVRSHPYSRFAPQFNREPLQASLEAQGLRYVFLGSELGGRPEGPEHYDDEGHVRYDSVAASELFRSGLARLVQGLQTWRVAVMCSEEDPMHCHRRLLVSRVLLDHGVEIAHLRGSGLVQSEPGFSGDGQGDLFAGFAGESWRSTRSVLQKRVPASSSAS